MADPLDTLDSLYSSLDELEDALEPLFAKTLAQTEENLEPEQKAKLQVLLTYVIQDLVLVFLKSKGLDPSKHPVSEELKRVKAYFEKIKEVENPATRTLVVDRAAANRFIRAAISDAKAASLDAREDFPPLPSVGKHTRFTHTSASSSTAVATGPTGIKSSSEELTDDTSSSDSDLEVIDNIRPSGNKGKGKQTHSEPASAPIQALASTKRRRMVDPFAGYSADASETVPHTKDSQGADNPNDSRKRRKRVKPNTASS